MPTLQEIPLPPANDQLVAQAFAAPKWYLTRTAFNIRVRAETVRAFLGNAPCADILDIGCGDGSLSLPLLTPRRRLTLLDRSATMLSIARSRVPLYLADRLTVINDDVRSAALARQQFDLIICVGVLAYIEDLPAFLAKVRSLLKPGGRLILECSDATHPVRRLYRAYDRLRRLFGARDFDTIRHTRSDVLALVRDFGFELRGTFRYCWVFPIVRKFLSQGFSYSLVRTLYGTAGRNRFAAAGSECIFYLQLAE